MENILDTVELLYEDADVLVVAKPAGLVVHADGRTEEPNLCDWILEHYPEISGVGEPIEQQDGTTIERPGIVHRLDRDTSGVLIIARTSEAHAHLKGEFKERRVKKEYAVFAEGELPAFHFSVEEPIGRSTGDFRKWTTPPGVRGKTRVARTVFQSVMATNKASFLKAFPETGRTHQIRVHLKHLNHPVICDDLYGQGENCALGFDRQALHARSITFTLVGGEEKTVEAKLPADFERALQKLKKSA